MLSLLPKYENGEIIDGTFIKAYQYCLQNCKKGKCISFYNKIICDARTGFFQCPCGMTVYFNSDTNNLFTCFKNKLYYDSKKENRILNKLISTENPLLNNEEALNLIHSCELTLTLEKKERDLSKYFDTLIHEIKGLNSGNVTRCDDVLQTYFKEDENNLTNEEYLKLKEKIRTIYFSSHSIRQRFELENLDEKIDEDFDDDRDISIYGKFLKIKKFYTSNKQKIPINGQSFKMITANSKFEYIPLLLIDNAVKYSYDFNPVNIDFIENDNLIVSVESFGPSCSDEEMSHITEKGFRGAEARLMKSGSGLGLYYVKKLCDYYDIDLSFEVGEVHRINGMNISKFKVILKFN